MKICRSCGSQCADDSRFCVICGSPDLVQQPEVQPVVSTKHLSTKFDLMTIFGFTAALIGLFQIALILEPLALLSSLVGFLKGKRFRGLAIAGFVIALISLLVRLFVTLYRNGVIPEWLISGIFG